MTPTKLAVDQLSKRYGPVTALEPTSLDVRQGEFLTLLGPSGSGKTTLLMMIAGLAPPSTGRLTLEGRDITRMPAHLREIGVVFQNYALFPHLTVFENVAFPLRMRRRGDADIREAVQKALTLVQLPHLAERLPRELSGGQQQRIAFARALVFRPSLILMDEPLGALDKKLRDELKLEIRRLHRELGATILYVTHDQEEAMLLSDRVCLMNNARIEQIDTPAALYARPVSRFAASFIGDSNLIEAEIRDGAAQAGTLTLRPSQGLPTDGPVTLMIRPESLRFGDGPNAIAATIDHVLDLGATRRISLIAPAGLRLTMLVLNGALLPAPGTVATVSIAAEDIVVLEQPQ